MNPADGGHDRRHRPADQRPPPQRPEEGEPAPSAIPSSTTQSRKQDEREIAQRRMEWVSTDPQPTGHAACITATSRMTKPETATSAWITITGMGRALFCMCWANR